MPIKDIKTYIDLCMRGISTIDQRKKMLNQHKENVLKKQRILERNLFEIETKINRYSSDDSVEIIKKQIDFVQDEKEQLHLKNPFI